MKNKYLSISVAMATFNSEFSLKLCLDSLFSQDYPKEKIELIIADGGSRDGTLEILKNYPHRLFKISPDKQEAEYNKGVAVEHAKNEIILLIDHDNILPHKNWLKNMVAPFVENSEITGVEVLRFNHNPKDNILDKAVNLIKNPIENKISELFCPAK